MMTMKKREKPESDKMKKKKICYKMFIKKLRIEKLMDTHSQLITNNWKNNCYFIHNWYRLKKLAQKSKVFFSTFHRNESIWIKRRLFHCFCNCFHRITKFFWGNLPSGMGWTHKCQLPTFNIETPKRKWKKESKKKKSN